MWIPRWPSSGGTEADIKEFLAARKNFNRCCMQATRVQHRDKARSIYVRVFGKLPPPPGKAFATIKQKSEQVMALVKSIYDGAAEGEEAWQESDDMDTSSDIDEPNEPNQPNQPNEPNKPELTPPRREKKRPRCSSSSKGGETSPPASTVTSPVTSPPTSPPASPPSSTHVTHSPVTNSSKPCLSTSPMSTMTPVTDDELKEENTRLKQINADMETKLEDVQSRLAESKELMKQCRDALKGARGKKELYTKLNLALGCES